MTSSILVWKDLQLEIEGILIILEGFDVVDLHQALTMSALRDLMLIWAFVVDPSRTQMEMSSGLRSGEQGGHTSFAQMKLLSTSHFSVSLAVCAGAPYCINMTLLVSHR